jgi:hypothetical protein
MIDLTELEQYFPNIDTTISQGKYKFTINLYQDSEENNFGINLRIQQDDTKEAHLVKFRLGMEKDKETNSKTHQSDKPHFEVNIYKREERAFSADIYFTFEETTDEKILEYAKGTVVIITRIIDSFVKNNSIDVNLIGKLVYEKAILKELGKYENILIGVLYECYKHSQLIVKQKGQEPIIIKTAHNLKKFLSDKDLEPLFLPLLKKIEK